MAEEVKNIPFINYHNLNKHYEKDFHEILSKLIDKSWYILGENVTNFENQYADFNNTKHCIGVANALY